MFEMRLILASGSPRRAELLSAAGFDFDVRPVQVDETPLPGESPSAYVLRVAVLKAQSYQGLADGEVVVAADTTVVVDGAILGKPDDDADARRMLRLLSGREHEVLTGVALRENGRIVSAVEATRVHVLPLSGAEVDWYVASGEPADKAGAYGVQGLAARFVDRIDGSYSNVVGLPVSRVFLMLKALAGEEPSLGPTVEPFPVTD